MYRAIFIWFAIFAYSCLAKFNEDDYKCSICVASVEKMSELGDTFQVACQKYFPELICSKFHVPEDKIDLQKRTARQNCQLLNYCPAGESDYQAGAADIRVSKAVGSRGYNQVRVSVIANQTYDADFVTYKDRFQYRWTDKFISTGLVSVTPGVKTAISIAGKQIEILLPPENSGTRGVIIADPCISSQWIVCVYREKFHTFDYSTQLLNAINSHDDVSYWQILGDNFYDQEGAVSSQWFDALSLQTKSKMFATVPGNHDFWVNSAPKLYVPKDQLGHGFIQFYGQDSLGASSKAPYDFSVNPDATGHNSESIPAASNFFFYNKVGNVGFIGYSGAHTFDSMKSYFSEACQWAQDSKPDVVLLLGHWNNDGDGCEEFATVPNIYTELQAMPECAPLTPKFKYFMGHKHCNTVTLPDVGFMVGANGMSDASCAPEFGFPVIDTTGGRYRVYYFKVVDMSTDNFQTILDCINSNGVSGCYHLATAWSDVSL